jgi:hypothetical protein
MAETWHHVQRGVPARQGDLLAFSVRQAGTSCGGLPRVRARGYI